MLKKVFGLLILVAVLVVTGCAADEDITTMNMSPVTNATYNIGTVSDQYLSGYFVNLWASNDVTATNNMTATYFLGDGSQLTGIEQGELILYFLSTDSPDVAGTDRLSSIYNTSEVTLTGVGLAAGNTLLGTWITDENVPNIRLLEGNMRVHVTGKKTAGTKEAQFFYEVWKCNAAGTDIELVSTSEYSDVLTNVRVDYRMWALSDETSFNYSDRIKIKGYAYVTGGGSAPTIEAYIQGASNTRLTIPVGGISIERFVPYTNAVMDLVMGAYDISAHDGTFTSDVDITDDLTCDVAYTRTVGIEESLYHVGDPDTFIHFNTDEMYFKSGDVIGLEITDTLATFYNNMSIRQDGTIVPVSMADASAPNNSIYYSTTQSKLVYKDSTGTVHDLY